VHAEERAQLFRTAWDFAGSALGSRVDLYERFYLSSAGRNLTLNHLTTQADGRLGEPYRSFLEASGISGDAAMMIDG
jgi:aromatic ring hydroxylase